jgi:hypothetical protein
VTATLSSNSASVNPNTGLTILSVSITTDGFTEIRAEINCFGVSQATLHTGDWGLHKLQVDGTTINSATFAWQHIGSASGFTTDFGPGAGTFVGYATPSAGVHTVSWQLFNAAASSNSSYVSAVSTLRVGPAFN